ncbi:hypothetical protein HanPSC8_Chr12g0529331 [Helianthus annuus]|nr:hypothetical protein HanPSC8_Chr12g0529331 [Helianthus annuus]
MSIPVQSQNNSNDQVLSVFNGYSLPLFFPVCRFFGKLICDISEF